MHKHATEWLARLRQQVRGDATPPPPKLPRRRRALTLPSPSPLSTAESAFFQRLPEEIRQLILKYAFGMATLHMHLSLEHPPGDAYFASQEFRHANIPLASERDRSRSRHWEWTGHRCHRTACVWRGPPAYDSDCSRPVMDVCQSHPDWAGVWCRGPRSGECYVGAMGWLLACRQAYQEGIGILYETNRFHIQSQEVFRQLPDVLRPQRLAAMREVELLWDIQPYKPWDEEGMAEFHRSIRELPKALPNLQFLYLSLQTGLEASNKPVYKNDIENRRMTNPDKILEEIDYAIRSMKFLRDCRIALPSCIYRGLKFKANGKGISWEHTYSENDAVWRNVSCDDGTLTGSPKGYWICHGQMDTVHPLLYPEAPQTG